MVATRHKRKSNTQTSLKAYAKTNQENTNEHADVEWWSTDAPARKRSSEKESIQESSPASLQELESRFLRLLTDEYHYAMFAMEDSLLLVDNLGTQNGMRTSRIAREIEEFVALVAIMDSNSHSCFGYKFGVLRRCVCCLDTNFSSVVKMGEVRTDPSAVK
jgi:hypothetical protein